jgi:NhaA family Na+:H+ antiporter
MASLAFSAVMALVLFVMNRMKVAKLAPYLLVGLVLWVAVLKSGVHATLAGVIIGLMIPLRDANDSDHSPLIKLEHILHPYVAFLILPMFAFANAGVSFEGLDVGVLLDPVTLGIALGLFFGKQIGVMGVTAIGKGLKIIDLPRDTSWLQYYGMALVTGIGFTMSLFIGTLAFDSADYATSVRLGVLGGSTLAGLAGYFVLLYASKCPEKKPAEV